MELLNINEDIINICNFHVDTCGLNCFWKDINEHADLPVVPDTTTPGVTLDKLAEYSLFIYVLVVLSLFFLSRVFLSSEIYSCVCAGPANSNFPYFILI